MRGNRHAARFVNHPIRGQRVRRRADFAAALIELIRRHAQREQQMLELAHGRIGRENSQDMKPERSGKFESGQNQNLFAQAAIFAQPLALVIAQSA